MTDRSVGEGVSESGAQYRFDDTYSSTTVFQIGRPGGSLFTHLTRMKHVGGGAKATDLTLMTGTLVAWDGAGNTLADRSFVRTRCR